MSDDLVAGFKALRPAIQARWEARLREKTAISVTGHSIVTPDRLVLLVEDSLRQLGSRLPETLAGDRQRRDLLPYLGMRAGCRCGLHLMIGYYLAGLQALTETILDDPDRSQVELLHHFNRVAHDDLAALGAICPDRGGPFCSLPADLPPGSADPGHRRTGAP